MGNQTPAELGYRFPAEWEKHTATWMSWPHEEGISFPGSYERVMPTFVEMVRALSTSEKVCINVRDAQEEKEVRARFRGEVPGNVQFFHIPTNEPWCRDHGPIFLDHPQKGGAIVDWGYNAWGGKYPPFDKDDDVPTRVSEFLKLPVFYPKIVMEGGSLDGNGEGTLLTTEACLLNPNRNPTLNREQIEQKLRDYLGVKQILWLGDGIEGDDTDGHVDDLTRFINRDTVLTIVESDKTDANYEPLRENSERLKTMKLFDGTPLKVIDLPMPKKIEREDTRLPASYANFYIGNQVILLPVYKDPSDAEAISVVSKAFPHRKVVPIDCRELIWGLGAFHCLTQQQPEFSK